MAAIFAAQLIGQWTQDSFLGKQHFLSIKEETPGSGIGLIADIDTPADFSTEASKAFSQTHPTTDTSINAFDPPAAL